MSEYIFVDTMQPYLCARVTLLRYYLCQHFTSHRATRKCKVAYHVLRWGTTRLVRYDNYQERNEQLRQALAAATSEIRKLHLVIDAAAPVHGVDPKKLMDVMQDGEVIDQVGTAAMHTL
jgi:hypothetical protein